MRNQKTAHAIIGQGWMSDCAEEPPDHDEHMKQQADFGHTKVKHAQGPDITSLYPANTECGEVIGQR